MIMVKAGVVAHLWMGALEPLGEVAVALGPLGEEAETLGLQVGEEAAEGPVSEGVVRGEEKEAVYLNDWYEERVTCRSGSEERRG